MTQRPDLLLRMDAQFRAAFTRYRDEGYSHELAEELAIESLPKDLVGAIVLAYNRERRPRNETETERAAWG